MNTLVITKNDLNEQNEYVGTTDLDGFQGHVEIAEGLGCVRFARRIRVSGFLFAKAGSGINAGRGI